MLPVKETLPTINRVSGQVIKRSSRHVDQVNGEELDDKEVIVCPTRSARDVVVHQPITEIGFAVILDDVVGRTKTLSPARIVHVAPESFRP
jgi:hypothetical protein